jgi:hypothetical protein
VYSLTRFDCILLYKFLHLLLTVQWSIITNESCRDGVTGENGHEGTNDA